MEREYAVWRLSQLKYLKREVEQLSQKIAEMEMAEENGTARIAGMPRTGGGMKCRGQIACMRGMLEERRMRCLGELAAIYRFIDDVKDSAIRQILTLRYIDGKTWLQVAMAIGEYDEQYPRRIHNAFLAGCRLDENDGEEGVLLRQEVGRGREKWI